MRYFLKLELDESYAVAYHAYKAFTFVQGGPIEFYTGN